MRAVRTVIVNTVLLLVAPLAGARSGPYAISDLLDVAYPTDLVAAAAADRIGWISDERGSRNVWTAAAPDFLAKPLTHFSGDDGQDLTALQLSRDGTLAVWVRGGAPDAGGFSQNPQSLAGGVEQEIWAISTAGGEPRKLGAGNSPVLSPDGSVVLSIHDKALQCTATRLNVKAPVWCTSPLLKLRGRNGGARFSPDGARIAFVSDRDDHSFIGIFDTASRGVTWLAPDANRDDFPTWSPDGKRVAFVRIAGLKINELQDITAAWPFELWIADASSGAGRKLFRSNDIAGGFAQIDVEGPAHQPVRWGAADQLLFFSEQSGWLHLYALPVSGGSPRDLSPGNCEAESESLSSDAATLIFSGNCAEIDGRQLFRVSLAGGDPKRLPAASISVSPTFVGTSKQYAYLSADAVQPLAITLANADGSARRIYPATLPANFPARALVKPQVVMFKAADGLTIHGQLFNTAATGKRPALIFVHGGPVRQMLPGWHYMGYYSNTYALNQYLASRGFVVLSVNYRDGIGYGQAFRRAQNQGPRGASEYQDVLAGQHFLAQLANVDSKRIGIWGGSYGGLLTAQALARNSDLFAAGVDYHGVHDWTQFGKEYGGGGWAIDDALHDVALKSSPIAEVRQWRSPVLFIHGDDDRSVPFIQTTDMVQRLREQGVPVETLIFPDEEHAFLRHATVLKAYEATADFLERKLQP